MQAVLAIPGLEALRNYGEPSDVLLRPVAGVPLLARVLATAARAGVDSVLVIFIGMPYRGRRVIPGRGATGCPGTRRS